MSHSDCPADYVEIRRAICPAKRAAVEYALQPVGCTKSLIFPYKPTDTSKLRIFPRKEPCSRRSFHSRFLFDSLADSVGETAVFAEKSRELNRKLELSFEFSSLSQFENFEESDVNTSMRSNISKLNSNCNVGCSRVQVLIE